MRSALLLPRSARTLAHSLGWWVLCVFVLPAVARGDFAVTYRATSASLVLFQQPQPSPFAGVGARVFVKGNRVRLEATDHWGRRHVWISDRSAHKTWYLLENKTYTEQAGGWSCDHLPMQFAGLLADGLRQAGIDSLSIAGPVAGTWQSAKAHVTRWTFRARVFGLPRPVWIRANVYFPLQETAYFGADVAEIYCGHPPGAEAWQAAFEKYLSVPREGCRALAGVMALPLALEFTTDLGMGAATLVLEAGTASDEPLDESLFRVPADYRPASPSE
jgi:hypothetical protein